MLAGRNSAQLQCCWFDLRCRVLNFQLGLPLCTRSTKQEVQGSRGQLRLGMEQEQQLQDSFSVEAKSALSIAKVPNKALMLYIAKFDSWTTIVSQSVSMET